MNNNTNNTNNTSNTNNIVEFENITEEYVNQIEEEKEKHSFEEILKNMKEQNYIPNYFPVNVSTLWDKIRGYRTKSCMLVYDDFSSFLNNPNKKDYSSSATIKSLIKNNVEFKITDIFSFSPESKEYFDGLAKEMGIDSYKSLDLVFFEIKHPKRQRFSWNRKVNNFANQVVFSKLWKEISDEADKEYLIKFGNDYVNGKMLFLKEMTIIANDITNKQKEKDN